MSIVRDRLYNRIGDRWMNDRTIGYIEKDKFFKIDNEGIRQRYQSIKTRKEQV